MSNDPSPGGGVPDEVSAWLADVADERGLTEQELLERLVSGDGVELPVEPSHEVADLGERIEALESSVEALEDALDDQIQDVRDRVVQVKRETDAKASREHDHPEVLSRLERVGEHVEALGNDFVDLTASVDRLEEDVEDVEDLMNRGFSNYEEVLEYLVDATDDLNRKVDTVARTVMDLRATSGRLESAAASRKDVDRLREVAVEHGVTAAKCEECGRSVELGLLTSPDCPGCESTFVRLDPRRGFFRSAVLRTGRQPALEGQVEGGGSELEAIVETEVESPPDVRAGRSAADEEPAAADDAPPSVPDAGGNPAADLDVEDVSGIGTAYAERLREAGVETVGQLALADAEGLAAETEIPPARVHKWVDRSRELLDSE